MRNYSSIRLEVTSHCNLQCEYCHNSEYSNRKDDMTTDEILRLIQNIKNHYPINKILLTGGEPLVNKDIFKIIEMISDLGIKADLVSNGTLLTEEVIKKLEQAGLKRIRISIDELGEISSLRSITNPNNIWNTAKMITDISSIEVCIHTVCSPANVAQLFDVYKKTLEIGARRWRVFDLGYQGGIIDHKDNFVFDYYYDCLIDSTKKILKHYLENHLEDTLDIEINNIFRTMMLKMRYEEGKVDVVKALEARNLSSPCDYVADHQLSIRSNGVATLCQYFHNTIFDFKQNDFDIERAILNQNSVIENELIMKDLSYCSRCKYCLVCNSGCRSRAKFLTGNIKSADPGACYLIPRIHNEIITLLPEETQKVYNSFINFEGLEPQFTKSNLIDFLKLRGY